MTIRMGQEGLQLWLLLFVFVSFKVRHFELQLREFILWNSRGYTLECKGQFDIQEMHPITMDFILYILSRGISVNNMTFVDLGISFNT